MVSQLTLVTIQATGIAILSNIVGQNLDYYQRERVFNFQLGLPDLIRFIIFTILIVPPNYYWQLWLEHTFPAPKPNVAQQPSSAPKPHEVDEESIELGTYSDNIPDASPAEIPSQPSNYKWRFVRAAATKWFIDCMTMGALLNTIGFLLLMGMLKFERLTNILTSIRDNTIPIIVASYKFWPLVSVVNFTLIPVEKRVVFLGAMSLLWNVYLSILAAAV